MKGTARSSGLSICVMFALSLLMACAPAAPSPTAPPAQPAPTTVPAKQEAKAAPTSAPAQPPATKPADQPADQPATGPAKPAALTEIVVGQVKGQEQVFAAMMERGLDRKYGVQVKIVPFADFGLLNTAIANQQVEVAGIGHAPTALFRHEGKGTTAIFPSKRVTNHVLVRSESAINSFADARGKKIGLFGGPAAQTTLFFRAVTKLQAGIDPITGAQVQFGAPALLAGLLEQGEIDVFVSLEPIVTKLLATGKIRSIGELGDIYTKVTGKEAPSAGVTTTTDAVIQRKGPALTNMLRGYIEGAKFLQTDESASFWDTSARDLGFTDPKEIALLRQRTAPSMLAIEWDEKVVQAQIDALKLFMELSPDFLPALPDGTFNTTIAPK